MMVEIERFFSWFSRIHVIHLKKTTKKKTFLFCPNLMFSLDLRGIFGVNDHAKGDLENKDLQKYCDNIIWNFE